MPETGALIGTPASMSERVEPQTEPIDDEPFDSSVSETIRIVYGKSSGPGMTASSARCASAPWPMSRRYMHHYNFPPYSVGETGFMRGEDLCLAAREQAGAVCPRVDADLDLDRPDLLRPAAVRGRGRRQ